MDKIKRFTSKYPDNTPMYYKYYLNGYHYEQGEFIDKLGHFEDLEEKLGITLDIFVHAMFKGIYFKKDNDIKCVTCIQPATTQILGILGFFDFDDPKITDKEPHYCFHKESDYWLFEDYGKTWALTREELENG